MIKNLPKKMIVLATLGVAAFLMSHAGIPCIFRFVTGINCPGCGMTRACLSALRFDFAGAFRFHWMFWTVPVLLIYFLFDGKVFGKKWDIAIFSFFGIGYFANWIYHLINGIG